MNESQGLLWDILKTLSNVVSLILAGAVGWLTRKFAKMDERMDGMEKDFTDRNQLAAISITQLKAYHEANTHRLSAIEDCTREINKKLDRLIERKGKRGGNE